MSVQAWLVRRKIRQLYRPASLKDAPLEVRGAHFRKTLVASEPHLPKPPADTLVEAVDTDGVKGEWVAAPGVRQDRILFYMHGGGYVWGGPVPHRELGWRLSKACNARVFLLDYRLAPAHRCPAPIEDALAAYRWLLAEAPGVPIVCAGDSAGGGLTLATAHAIRDADLPMPKALCLISPWLDVTGKSETIRRNAKRETMLDPEGMAVAGRAYTGDTMPLDDPRCSPLFGDQAGLPPVLVQVGSGEILLGDSLRFAEQMKAIGAEHRLDIWKNMHHVWHMSALYIPEGRKAIADMARFFDPLWSN